MISIKSPAWISSARLINLGVQMAQQGVVRYTITDEGDLVHYEERRLDTMGLADVADKVEFLQGMPVI